MFQVYISQNDPFLLLECRQEALFVFRGYEVSVLVLIFRGFSGSGGFRGFSFLIMHGNGLGRWKVMAFTKQRGFGVEENDAMRMSVCV